MFYKQRSIAANLIDKPMAWIYPFTSNDFHIH